MLALKAVIYFDREKLKQRSPRVVELPEPELMTLVSKHRHRDQRGLFSRLGCRLGLHVGRQIKASDHVVSFGDLSIHEWRCLGCGRVYWGESPEHHVPASPASGF